MKRNKLILYFNILLSSIIAFSVNAQIIESDILESLRKKSKEEPVTEKAVEEKREAEPFIPETLSTIEIMYRDRYFMTNERKKLEVLRDSLSERVYMESLKVEIRRSRAKTDTLFPPDTIYINFRRELSKVINQIDLLSITIKQYGYKSFKTTFQQIPPYIPVSDEYVLGPGDILAISISGELNDSWLRSIDRDGKIVLPKIGPINLWGKTYKEARETINEYLRREFSNIKVSINLEELRSVSVFILGEVRNPGLYSVSIISNPLSILFNAGGPKKTGTLRRVKYIPKDGKPDIFDIYNLLIEGKRLRDIQLESGDIIYVPPIGDVVGITGAVTRPRIYEITPYNDLSDVLYMAGGMLPTGGKFRIQLERVSNGISKTVEDFSFKNTEDFSQKTDEIKIKNGDLIEIFEIPNIRHNYVSIEGNVHRSGTYGLSKGMTILDLLEKAGGYKEGTYLKRADLMRFKGVEYPELIEINLKDIMEGDTSVNLSLREWDKLKIYSIDDIKERFTVTISGAIQNPGIYPLYPDMTLNDLLFKGIPLRSAANKGELFRLDPDKGVSLRTINISDSTDLNIKLKPEDYILIQRKATYREAGYISIDGEVLYPGIYPIKIGEPLINAIDRAGGFTENAYLEGARFSRMSVAELQRKAVSDLVRETRMRLISEQRNILEGEMTEEERTARMNFLTMQQRQIASLSRAPSPGRVVIDLTEPNQLDIPLEDGDSLFIPTLPKTVQVIGQVYNPTGITYEENLKLNDYLDMAGGPKPTADKRQIYVRRASGKVMKDPDEIRPGDTIIVPEKIELGRSFWDILGSFATIFYQIGLGIAAIAALINATSGN